jgi:hypothetical protein
MLSLISLFLMIIKKCQAFQSLHMYGYQNIKFIEKENVLYNSKIIFKKMLYRLSL